MIMKPSGASINMRQCGECGSDIVKAHKIHAGTALCQTCYQRLFKRRKCVKCGGVVRALSQDPEPTCSSCRRADRVCLRCERPVPTAALIFKGKPVCPSCAPYFREIRPCPKCGKASSRLSRIVGVTDEQVCDSCRRKLLCATCSVCGRHRERFALAPDGKPLCKRCAANPGASHACPDCGKEIGGVGNAPCLPCGMIRSFRKKADALAGILQHSDTRRLLADYVEWVVARESVNMALRPLPKVVEMLGRVERSAQDGGVLTSTMIDKTLTTEEIRCAGLFAMFLAERGFVIGSAQERAAASDARRIDKTLSEIRGRPWEKAIREYADELSGSFRALSPRSQRTYLRAAVELMAFSHVERVSELTDEHIRKFLYSKPGHRASLFSWINFVSERLGHGLSIPKKPQRKEQTIKAVADGVAHLISAIRASLTKEARRALVAKLLSVLYGVPLERVLAMERASMDRSDGKIRLQFGDDWVTVEMPIDDLLSEAVGEPATDVGLVRLFPGRMGHDGLSVSAVRYYLQKLSNAV